MPGQRSSRDVAGKGIEEGESKTLFIFLVVGRGEGRISPMELRPHITAV